MPIEIQTAAKNLTVQNKCFRGSLDLPMAKATNENISALMSITKKDRDSVICALNQVGGDLGLAVEALCGSGPSSGAERSRDIGGESGLAVDQAGNRMMRPSDLSRPGTSGTSLGRRTREGDGEDGGYLTLKVVRPSQEEGEGIEIHFRVKQTTQMGKLKRSYSDRLGVAMTSLRFLYDGKRIPDDATPGMLEMESGDYIEVYRELGRELADVRVQGHGVVAMDEARASKRPDSAPLAAAMSYLAGKEQEHAGLFVDKELQEVQLEIDQEEESRGTKRMSRHASGNMEEANTPSKRRRETSRAGDEEGVSLTNNVREELERITKKYEDLVKKLRDKVECPVCFDVPRKPPVPVCPNGHVVCVRCARAECPTCRVKMERGTSTLAVTVIENIDHQCDHEGCDASFPLAALDEHQATCRHRLVKCPGLDCPTKIPLSRLKDHALACCVERAEIKPHPLPHRFTYMMNEDAQTLSSESQNFMWRLEGIMFEEETFFLKVTRKARRGRWFFFVQMIGSAAEVARFGVTMIVFRKVDSDPRQ